MAEKTLNYTPEMTAEIVEKYVANPTKETVETLAEQFGKTVRSIVAKLSREGVYVAKAKAEPKAKRVPKAERIETLAEAMGVASEKLESLENVPVAVIDLLIAALTK